MKKPKSKKAPNWSKRSALQYAYMMTMGIHPDEIAKIEKERSEANKEEIKGLMLGAGLLLNIESIKEIEDRLPKFPEVPPDKILDFVYFREKWERLYGSPKTIPIGMKAKESLDKAFSDYFKGEEK